MTDRHTGRHIHSIEVILVTLKKEAKKGLPFHHNYTKDVQL